MRFVAGSLSARGFYRFDDSQDSAKHLKLIQNNNFTELTAVNPVDGVAQMHFRLTGNFSTSAAGQYHLYFTDSAHSTVPLIFSAPASNVRQIDASSGAFIRVVGKNGGLSAFQVQTQNNNIWAFNNNGLSVTGTTSNGYGIFLNGGNTNPVIQANTNTAFYIIAGGGSNTSTRGEVYFRESYSSASNYNFMRRRATFKDHVEINSATHTFQHEDYASVLRNNVDCVYKVPRGNESTIAVGPLVIGNIYEITSFSVGDDFTNVGASSNVNGERFIATGTTPTTWSNGTELVNGIPFPNGTEIKGSQDNGTVATFTAEAGITINNRTPSGNFVEWTLKKVSSTEWDLWGENTPLMKIVDEGTTGLLSRNNQVTISSSISKVAGKQYMAVVDIVGNSGEGDLGFSNYTPDFNPGGGTCLYAMIDDGAGNTRLDIRYDLGGMTANQSFTYKVFEIGY